MSTSPVDRSLKGLSLDTTTINPTSSFFSTAPSQATRRPVNLPSVHNPFSHSNGPTNQNSAAHTSEPPPAYTPAAPQAAPATDNPYAFLSTFDTVFLIDDSGSMAGSRWTETERALETITPICTAHDTNGIDIHFLNTPDSPTYTNVTSTERVNEIFSRVRPGGGTPTGSRLNALLRPYLRLCEAKGAARIEEVKPMNIIVITDGEAGDDPESVILSAARKLDKLDAPAWQLGIQFFQVGSDKEATKALRDLDDGLVDRGCGRDIVDTVPWRGQDGAAGLNADGILKVVLVCFTHLSHDWLLSLLLTFLCRAQSIDVWTARGTPANGDPLTDHSAAEHMITQQISA